MSSPSDVKVEVAPVPLVAAAMGPELDPGTLEILQRCVATREEAEMLALVAARCLLANHLDLPNGARDTMHIQPWFFGSNVVASLIGELATHLGVHIAPLTSLCEALAKPTLTITAGVAETAAKDALNPSRTIFCLSNIADVPAASMFQMMICGERVIVEHSVTHTPKIIDPWQHQGFLYQRDLPLQKPRLFGDGGAWSRRLVCISLDTTDATPRECKQFAAGADATLKWAAQRLVAWHGRSLWNYIPPAMAERSTSVLTRLTNLPQ